MASIFTGNSAASGKKPGAADVYGWTQFGVDLFHQPAVVATTRNAEEAIATSRILGEVGTKIGRPASIVTGAIDDGVYGVARETVGFQVGSAVTAYTFEWLAPAGAVLLGPVGVALAGGVSLGIGFGAGWVTTKSIDATLRDTIKYEPGALNPYEVLDPYSPIGYTFTGYTGGYTGYDTPREMMSPQDWSRMGQLAPAPSPQISRNPYEMQYSPAPPNAAANQVSRNPYETHYSSPASPRNSQPTSNAPKPGNSAAEQDRREAEGWNQLGLSQAGRSAPDGRKTQQQFDRDQDKSRNGLRASPADLARDRTNLEARQHGLTPREAIQERKAVRENIRTTASNFRSSAVPEINTLGGLALSKARLEKTGLSWATEPGMPAFDPGRPSGPLTPGLEVTRPTAIANPVARPAIAVPVVRTLNQYLSASR